MKLILLVTLCVVLGVVSSQEEFTPYVINGVRSAHAPYYAYIEYFNAANLGFFGGGALISNRHILTTATNIVGYPRIEVRMGSAARANLRPIPINREQITTHTGYNAQTRANDIAIIRLVTSILPGAEIAPIALPPITTPALTLPYENEEGFFAGFGVASQGGQPSNFLNRGYQRVTGNTRCTQFFIIDTNAGIGQGFCAEDTVERSSPCDGDLGNPFVVSYRRQEVLVGLVKMHPPCGQMSPTAYTRITHFRTWIEDQMRT